LTRALGEGGAVTSTAEQIDLDETISNEPAPAPASAADSGNDDTMSYFAKLAAEN